MNVICIILDETCINLVQGFCPLKIKMTQFPDGFCLEILLNMFGQVWP